MSIVSVHVVSNRMTQDNKTSGTLARPSSYCNSLARGSKDSIIDLQQTIDNQTVKQPADSNAGFNFAKIAIQPKLKVSQPGDIYEQEADRAAEHVMGMTSDEAVGPSVGAKTTDNEQIGRKCIACGMRESEDEKKMSLKISRKPSPNIDGLENTDGTMQEIDNALSSGSFPLDPNTRQFMESRFGYDFSKVKIHTDERAARSSNSVNALAYTVGNDIIFAPGQYQPDTLKGRRLLAHELTHVVHQNGVPATVQRAPAGGGSPPQLTIGDIDIKSNDPHCLYEAGEVAKARTPKGILPFDVAVAGTYGIYPSDAMVVVDFKVDDGTLRPSAESELRKWIAMLPKGSTGMYKVIGYSDCVGWESVNAPLREQRAQAVARLLPGAKWAAAAYDEYLVPNTSHETRALNRAAIILPWNFQAPIPIPNAPVTPPEPIFI